MEKSYKIELTARGFHFKTKTDKFTVSEMMELVNDLITEAHRRDQMVLGPNRKLLYDTTQHSDGFFKGLRARLEELQSKL